MAAHDDADGGKPLRDAPRACLDQSLASDGRLPLDLDPLGQSYCHRSTASGRYFGVYDSWHWQDIYAEIQKLLPDMKMPELLSEPPVPATRFDFTRRDSLGVPLRDIPTMLRETIEWIRTDSFTAQRMEP